jgi:Cd2+/Zn2+-exporting ATPase
VRARHLNAGVDRIGARGAAQQGVLIKGGVHLERLAGVRVVAFDKTGTVTTGRLTLDALHPVEGGNARPLLELAASVESQSEHPIASAILAAAKARGITPTAPANVRALPGLGVEGQVRGAEIVCGTPRLFAERGVMTPAIAALAARVVKDGMSPIVVARDGVPIGVLGVTDRPKAGAARVVSDLRAQGVTRVAMITGDHDAAAQATGAELGVDDVHSGQLPEDKVTAVENLRHAHGAIAMVGDGVNDAPALAAADVGIVMGAMGSDAALETADIALMTDELPKVPYTIRLSRATSPISAPTLRSRSRSRPRLCAWQSREWQRCGWRYSPTPAHRRWWSPMQYGLRRFT